MTKKRPARTRPHAFQVRFTDEAFARFGEMMERLQADAEIRNARGEAISRTDVVTYWVEWLLDLTPDDQREWILARRDDFLAKIMGRKGKAAPARAASDAASGDLPPVLEGGHTIGRANVPIEEVFKPRDRRSRRRADGNKMDAKAGR